MKVVDPSLSWKLLPRINVETLAIERSARMVIVHFALCTVIAASFFVPFVSESTGVPPGPLAVGVALHMFNMFPLEATQVPFRFPAAFGCWVSLVNVALCALPALLSARPTSPLWALYLVYPHVAARAFAPGASVWIVGLLVAVPPLGSVLWHLSGAVPFSRSLGLLTVYGLGGAAVYLLLTRANERLDAIRQRHTEAEGQAAAEAERRWIARELHTTLGAGLTEIAIWHEVAQAAPADRAERALDRARSRTRLASEELRLAVDGFEGRDVSAPELEGLLRRRLEGLCEAAQIVLSLDLRASLPLPSSRAYHLCRLVQEATLNSVRHGQPRTLRVQLALDEPRLSIEDDGRGFALQSVPRGRGLAALQEHAAALGCACEIQSAPGEGTAVRVAPHRG